MMQPHTIQLPTYEQFCIRSLFDTCTSTTTPGLYSASCLHPFSIPKQGTPQFDGRISQLHQFRHRRSEKKTTWGEGSCRRSTASLNHTPNTPLYGYIYLHWGGFWGVKVGIYGIHGVSGILNLVGVEVADRPQSTSLGFPAPPWPAAPPWWVAVRPPWAAAQRRGERPWNMNTLLVDGGAVWCGVGQ